MICHYLVLLWAIFQNSRYPSSCYFFFGLDCLFFEFSTTLPSDRGVRESCGCSIFLPEPTLASWLGINISMPERIHSEMAGLFWNFHFWRKLREALLQCQTWSFGALVDFLMKWYIWECLWFRINLNIDLWVVWCAQRS